MFIETNLTTIILTNHCSISFFWAKYYTTFLGQWINCGGQLPSLNKQVFFLFCSVNKLPVGGLTKPAFLSLSQKRLIWRSSSFFRGGGILSLILSLIFNWYRITITTILICINTCINALTLTGQTYTDGWLTADALCGRDRLPTMVTGFRTSLWARTWSTSTSPPNTPAVRL